MSDMNIPSRQKTAVKIELPVHGITLEFNTVQLGAGEIACSPDLFETCPSCGQRDCIYQCEYLTQIQSEETVADRLKGNGAIDAILSVILAHACAGVDIETPAYLEGIETAFQALENSA